MNGLAAIFFEIQAKEIIDLMKEVNLEELTFRNQATMVGLAGMLNEAISRVEKTSPEKAKELEEAGQVVWQEWYEKNQALRNEDGKVDTMMKILADDFN